MIKPKGAVITGWWPAASRVADRDGEHSAPLAPLVLERLHVLAHGRCRLCTRRVPSDRTQNPCERSANGTREGRCFTAAEHGRRLLQREELSEAARSHLSSAMPPSTRNCSARSEKANGPSCGGLGSKFLVRGRRYAP